MDTSPRASAAGYLRVSDADRDSALAELSEHFQAGRLTAAELDERTGQALSARTGENLAGLMADLPPLAVAEVTDAAGPRRAGYRALAAWAAVAVAAIGSVVVVLAVRGPGHGAPVPVVADPVRLPRPAPAGPEHGPAQMTAHWRPWCPG